MRASSCGTGISSAGTGKLEIEALTGLRAVAAFWVLLYHLRPFVAAAFPDMWNVFAVFSRTGYLGVDLFFILSGFIISYNYANRFATFSWQNYRRFLWARLSRLYPVHLFTLALLAGWILLAKTIDMRVVGPARYTDGLLIANILMVHGWSLPIVKSWNIPSWSISVEWAAYLLFPGFLAMALAAERAKAHMLALLTVFLIAGGIYASTDLRGIMAYGLIRIAAGFFAGCMLYRLYLRGLGRGIEWSAVIPVVIATIMVVGLIGHRAGFNTLTWAPPLLCLVVYGLALETCAVSRWLRRPSMLAWGRVSFSLYMIQAVYIEIMFCLIPLGVWAGADLVPKTVVLALFVALILTSAVFLHLWVEEPCRRGMRAWALRRPTRART